MDITLTNHPAQAQVKGVPQWHNGKPIPMFPDARAIRVDGLIVGYVEKNGPINFIVPPKALPEAMRRIVEEHVRETFPTAGAVSQVADRIETEDEES